MNCFLARFVVEKLTLIVEMGYTQCFLFFAQNVRQDSQIDLQGKTRFAVGTHAHQKKEVGISECRLHRICWLYSNLEKRFG